MVLCSSCRVNTIDRFCTNTPRTCYAYCTSHADIFTCSSHYRQMGNTDAAARLATGKVHASIAEDAETDDAVVVDAPRPGEPDASNVGLGSEPERELPDSGPSLPAEASQPILTSPPSVVQPQQPPASIAGSAATALSLAALRAELDADRAAALAERAALPAQLTAQAAATQRILAMLSAQQPSPVVAHTPPTPSPSCQG